MIPSERTQRQIERLLDEAEQAIAQRDWALVRQRAQDVLDLDPENADALDLAIGEFRAMKMQPSMERALRHKEVLKA